MSPERGFKSEGKKSSADFAGQNELKRFFRKKEKGSDTTGQSGI